MLFINSLRETSPKILFYCCILMLCLICFTGCSSIQQYGKNRLYDFADMFCFEGSMGPGMDVHCQVTDLFGTGLGLSSQEGIAMQGRYTGRTTRFTTGLLVVLFELSELASHQEEQATLDQTSDNKKALEYSYNWNIPNISFLMFIPACSYSEGAYVAWMEPSYWKNHWLRIFDIQAGASAWFGFHMGFSPGEFLDFLFGLTTLDIASDDEFQDQLENQ